MIEFLAAAIRIATPLLLAGLGGILSERAGVFAVGLEGMMLAGAFAATVGTWASGSAEIGVALSLVGGSVIGLVVAIVAVRFRADNMVTGLAANVLSLGLTSYFMRILAGGGQPVAIHLGTTLCRTPAVRPTPAYLSGDCRLRRAHAVSLSYANRVDASRGR
jgi:simple sugar transport system permease protein